MANEVSNILLSDGNHPIKDVTARDRITTLENSILTECIILGDSYARSWVNESIGYLSPNVGQIVCDLLGLNCHNYAVNASGYTISNNLFSTQANNAINDTSYDHTRVKYIIIIGGVNDVNNNPSGDIESARNSLVATLATNYPQAEIIIIANHGYNPPITRAEQMLTAICHPITSAPYKIRGYYDMVGFMVAKKSWYDNIIHPNEAGYRAFAEGVAALVQGGKLSNAEMLTVTAGTGWNTNDLSVYRSGNKIHIYGYASLTQAITDSTHVIGYINGLAFAGAMSIFVRQGNDLYPVGFSSGNFSNPAGSLTLWPGGFASGASFFFNHVINLTYMDA